VPQQFKSIDFRGEMILLGTGTSVGVPTIGCPCEVCESNDPRNRRTRCSAVIGLDQGNLLIDTSPDLRTQLLREGIGIVHAVLYTHEHVDHLYGLDDLRLFPFVIGGPIPLYCEEKVERRIRVAFDYAFSDRPATHPGAAPQLDLRRITLDPFELLGVQVMPIRLNHGPHFEVLGFRIGQTAYCTDVSSIPESSWHLLEGLDTLILDALRPRPHPTHLSVDQAVEIIDRLKPRQAFLTHLSHELDYAGTNATLPPNIRLAYDGQRIPVPDLMR
jgi:phosphoribosyl 1,2-cyclic phosphate phosphodiesterase